MMQLRRTLLLPVIAASSNQLVSALSADAIYIRTRRQMNLIWFTKWMQIARVIIVDAERIVGTVWTDCTCDVNRNFKFVYSRFCVIASFMHDEFWSLPSRVFCFFDEN